MVIGERNSDCSVKNNRQECVLCSSIANILCPVSLAISYVSHLLCAHHCAVLIDFNCNDENRILGK